MENKDYERINILEIVNQIKFLINYQKLTESFIKQILSSNLRLTKENENAIYIKFESTPEYEKFEISIMKNKIII